MKFRHLAAAVALSAGMAFNASAQDHITDNDSRYLPEPDMSLCMGDAFMTPVTFDIILDALKATARQTAQEIKVEAFTVGQDVHPKDATHGYTFMRVAIGSELTYIMIDNAAQKGCVITRDTYSDYQYDAIVRQMDKEREERKRKQETPSP